MTYKNKETYICKLCGYNCRYKNGDAGMDLHIIRNHFKEIVSIKYN